MGRDATTRGNVTFVTNYVLIKHVLLQVKWILHSLKDEFLSSRSLHPSHPILILNP